MSKFKIGALGLLMAIGITVTAYSQQVMTTSGTVTFVDIAGNIISVQTDAGTMVFDMTVQTDLFRYAHHMASIEIKKGDPVDIQYQISLTGRNNIVKLVDKKLDNF